MKILVVDDERIQANAFKEVLQDEGHTVTVVYSGKAALEALENDPNYDIVLTDFAMCDFDSPIDGDQLTKMIRAKNLTFPIVIISAASHCERHYAEWGANAFIAKPAMPEEIIATVNRLLEN